MLCRLPTIERNCPVCATPEFSRLFAEARYDIAHLDEFAFASRKLREYMHLRLHVLERCVGVYASPVFATGVMEAAYRVAAYDQPPRLARFAAETYGRISSGTTAPIAGRRRGPRRGDGRRGVSRATPETRVHECDGGRALASAPRWRRPRLPSGTSSGHRCSTPTIFPPAHCRW